MTPQRAPAALLIALGVALRARAIGFTRVADDWYHLSMVEGSYPVRRAPWELYDFIRATPAEHAALLARGTFPWWTDPDLHIAAWRPLASLTLSLDHALWARNTVGAHAHSLAWLAALLVAAWWWLAAILPRRVALLALALLCADEALTVPTAWLANRPSLMSGAFGLFAMGVMARRRAEPTRAEAMRVAGLTIASMASGEYGFALAGCAVAYELVAGRGALRERVRACAAVLLPCALYLAAWRALGHGVRGTVSYVDPIAHTATWLALAAVRLPALLAELVLTVPVERAASHVGAVFVGFVVAAVIAGIALARGDGAQRRKAVGLGAGALAALVPVLSAPPMGRLLLAAGPAFAASLAALAGCAWSPVAGACKGTAGAARALVVCAVALHLTAPVVRAWSDLAAPSWVTPDATFRALPGVDACHARDQDHVLLAARAFETVHTAPLRWQARGCARPRTWRVLSVPDGDVIAVRTDDRTLTMQPRGGVLFSSVAALWRAAPMGAGDRVTMPGFEAAVQAVSGGLPARVAYTFDRSLDDPRVVLWQATPRGFEQVRPPALRGGRLVAAPSGALR